MIISEEQARQAAEYLAHQQESRCEYSACTVSDSTLARAFAIAAKAPEMREERVAAARERMSDGAFDARLVADKMVSRIVSDSLR